MDSVRQKFQTLSKTMQSQVPAEQLADVEQRINKVNQDEPDIYRKLEFFELKSRIQSYFVVCERKLKFWTEKFGKQEEVAELLADYTVS